MSFSMFLRGAASKINVCSGALYCQNAHRLSYSALRGASTLGTIKPMQSVACNVLDRSRIQPLEPKVNYSTAAIPKNVESSGSKVTLWIAERVVSASLIATLPLALAFPSKPLDVILAVSLVAHTYWGFEAIVTEYVRPLLFGNIVPKILHVVVIVTMMLTLGGLFYLIFDDIGLAGTIRRLWSIKSKNQN